MMEYSSYLQQPTLSEKMHLLTAPQQRILGEIQPARIELQLVFYALLCPVRKTTLTVMLSGAFSTCTAYRVSLL